MQDERLLELVAAIRQALAANDVDRMAPYLAPDYVEEYPQSRELIRGEGGVRRLLDGHPRPPRVISPTRLTIIGEETVAAEEVAMYGDERWWIVALLAVADGKVTRQRAYYARPLEPPPWRSAWVIPIPDDAPPQDLGGRRDVDRDTVERYFSAQATGDLQALRRLRHEGFVHDMPQSGERFPSAEAYEQANSSYPGGPPRLIPLAVSGPRDRWVLGAGTGPLRVSGRGPHWLGEAELVYPNGERWFQVQFMDFRDGKVVSERSYWAEPFEAPAWREGISERY
ncbi:MAG TPA: nuclear transport factor 2 family protein [Candidatus Limnocylindrales bacterium]|nr:nuclear transport factor 2 family protein [Candidatus Limnocylindrales bacterium]